MSAIHLHSGDIVRDTLVTPAHCAGKCIAYTHSLSLAVRYATPSGLQRRKLRRQTSKCTYIHLSLIHI